MDIRIFTGLLVTVERIEPTGRICIYVCNQWHVVELTEQELDDLQQEIMHAKYEISLQHCRELKGANNDSTD